MIQRMFFRPWCLGVLCMLCAFSAAHGQTLTVYTTESSYDAAIPAGSLSTVENFAGVTSNTNVSQSTPDIWNGFTLLASGNTINYGDSRYCSNLASSNCVGYNNNTPALKGITAAMGAPGSYGGGQLFFTPTNPAFAIGMSNIDWNDSTQRSAIEITFSNNTTDIYIRPAQASGPPPEFVGFKIDAASISSGIYITSLRWYGVSSQELIGIWSVKTSSPPPADPMIVTSTADTNTVGTLRYAMNWANANAGDDNITFDIPGAGPHVITIGSALPVISDDGVSINGLSQPGASCGELSSGIPHQLQISIQSNGSPAIDAFDITHDFVSITGLAVGNFRRRGFHLRGSADSATIECNYWGVGPDGAISQPLSTNILTEANQVRGGNRSVIRNNLFSGNNDDTDDIGLIISDGADDVTIVGNIFGLNPVGDTALPNSGGGILIDGSSNVTIGGTSLANQNIISGNGGNGITLNNVSNATILGNYIGLGVNGTTDLGNGNAGIFQTNSTSTSIGNGNTNGRNVIGGNEGVGIASYNTTTDLSILGNYIGLDSSGNVALANGTNKAVDSRHAIEITNGTANNVTISDNVIGGYDRTGIIFFDITGSNNLITGNNIGVGADGVSDINTGQRFDFAGIGIGGVANGGSVGLTIGGANSGDSNLVANGSNNGIFIYHRTDVDILGNTIRDNINNGINLGFGGSASITENSIFNNGGLGIDLNADGVTANDNGDGDTGPNDLLNYPVINSVLGNGTNALTYDFNLDVLNAADGYRIEFFKTTSPDPTHGEGEFYLGFVDVAHAGGDLNFTGSFTASMNVAIGDSVSATTTRKTGSLTYDITSEFSANKAVEDSDPAVLAVTKSVENLVSGEYSLPGADMIYSFSVVNQGAGSVTADSIVLIDEMPPEITFFNGDFDGPGPETGTIGFEETSTGLSFNPATDAAYSNALTKPSNMTNCNYTPTTGYDPNVKYICFNPKGEMLGGDPDPHFKISFRAVIK